MKKKRIMNLRLAFVTSIFFILLVTAIFILPLAYYFAQHQPFGPGPFLPFTILLIFSVVLGTCISGMVGKIILRPINDISEATKAVATGDFTIRLESSRQIVELQDFFTNFNSMVQELSSIETLRNDFVLNVSHEFKTPLAAIEGCAVLLQDDTITQEERQEYITMIREASKQLSSLTGNILKLSKLESSDLPIEKAEFSLDEQLRQAVLQLDTQWAQKNIELEVDFDEALYHGNEELLLQVWQNLLTNAIKYSDNGGKVLVALYRTNKGISIQVEDHGIGMTETVQRHIFEKFYQGDTSRKTDGNGLGLALAQRIVMAHGGTIAVKSQLGQGSVFTVRLPQPEGR